MKKKYFLALSGLVLTLTALKAKAIGTIVLVIVGLDVGGDLQSAPTSGAGPESYKTLEDLKSKHSELKQNQKILHTTSTLGSKVTIFPINHSHDIRIETESDSAGLIGKCSLIAPNAIAQNRKEFLGSCEKIGPVKGVIFRDENTCKDDINCQYYVAMRSYGKESMDYVIYVNSAVKQG
jgi:hypothetical protein